MLRLPRPFWVFGYGSLMWRPGFPFTDSAMGWLTGYHRALCVRSHHHRGTPERNGLVVGLDRGGRCHGRLFQVSPGKVPGVLAYLREREGLSGVYEPCVLSVRLDRGQGAGLEGSLTGGRTVRCLAFRVRRSHKQYLRCRRGQRAETLMATLVRQGQGWSGSCLDYLDQTLRLLRASGVREPRLEYVLKRARALPVV
ncbi:MAG: gamma-glutamylcyclotransferase [Rhodospirillales bacterium]